MVAQSPISRDSNAAYAPANSIQAIGAPARFAGLPLDQTTLKARRDLFLDLHQHRISEIHSRLSPSIAHVLNALPALLHYNTPSLPGYCDADTPQGLDHFQPTPQTRQALQFVAPTFDVQQQHLRGNAQQIQAVFLMGSIGSMAQTRSSDIDVWVCVEPQLRAALQPKLEALTRWARQFGADLQMFAVNPVDDDAAEPMSPLLLDEFYRSACWLAGRLPMWWLVPQQLDAGQYNAFIRCLRQERRLMNDGWIDFGPVRQFSPTELFLAAVTELENSLTTPHKSLLKLALLESYAHQAEPLASQFKASVLTGVEFNRLDPYLMLAKHLDAHFTTHAPEPFVRQQFLRRAWVIKTARGNARLKHNPTWLQLVQLWGFSVDEVEKLRWPERWSLAEYEEENQTLGQAYTEALEFATSMLAESRQPMPFQALPRFDRLQRLLMPGEATPCYCKPQPDFRCHATIRHTESWQLTEGKNILATHSRLAGIHVWLARHNIGVAHLRPHRADSDRHYTRHQQISAALQIQGNLLLLNAEPVEAESPATLITDKDCPLSYGTSSTTLITSADWISGPSRTVHHADFATLVLRAVQADTCTVVCIGNITRARITRCVEQLIAQARQALTQPDSLFTYPFGPKTIFMHRNTHNQLTTSDRIDGVGIDGVGGKFRTAEQWGREQWGRRKVPE